MDRLNAAAVMIQASLRSHLRSKTSTTSPDNTTAAKKSVVALSGGGSGFGGNGGGVSAQHGRSSPPSPPGKENSRSPRVAVDADDVISAGGSGGIAAGGDEPGTLEDETDVLRATVQMQVQYPVPFLRKLVRLCTRANSQEPYSIYRPNGCVYGRKNSRAGHEPLPFRCAWCAESKCLRSPGQFHGLCTMPKENSATTRGRAALVQMVFVQKVNQKRISSQPPRVVCVLLFFLLRSVYSHRLISVPVNSYPPDLDPSLVVTMF